MKSGSLIVMGFLVVGVWYSVGYIQGSEVNSLRLDVMYKEGVRDGEKATAKTEA